MPKRSRSRSNSPPSESHHKDRRHRGERREDRGDRDRGGKRERHHERSRSPRHRAGHHRSRGGGDRRRERSHSPRYYRERQRQLAAENEGKFSETDFKGKSNEEVEMMKVMGFQGFDTTKNKQVGGNEWYGANVKKKKKYRQYMNRKGGFNRALDYIN